MTGQKNYENTPLFDIFSSARKGGQGFRSDVYGIPYKCEIFIRFAYRT